LLHEDPSQAECHAFRILHDFEHSDCNRPKTWAAAQVLKRINAEIEGRRRAGEDLPPPPKTAIAGPEYFGLNQPEVGNNLQPHTKAQNCSIKTLRLLLF
jgi:hypothetical protein